MQRRRKSRRARSQTPPRSTRARTPHPRRRPHCKPNKKYSCNFDNVTSGKCPGYLVERRRKQSRDEVADGERRARVYDMIWRAGLAQDDPLRSVAPQSGTRPAADPAAQPPRGYNFTSKRAIHYGAAGAQSDTQCLPRDERGNIQPAARAVPPNEYCQRYRGPAVRQQRGCVAVKGAKRPRVVVPPLEPSRSRSGSRARTPLRASPPAAVVGPPFADGQFPSPPPELLDFSFDERDVPELQLWGGARRTPRRNKKSYLSFTEL